MNGTIDSSSSPDPNRAVTVAAHDKFATDDGELWQTALADAGLDQHGAPATHSGAGTTAVGAALLRDASAGESTVLRSARLLTSLGEEAATIQKGTLLGPVGVGAAVALNPSSIGGTEPVHVVGHPEIGGTVLRAGSLTMNLELSDLQHGRANNIVVPVVPGSGDSLKALPTTRGTESKFGYLAPPPPGSDQVFGHYTENPHDGLTVQVTPHYEDELAANGVGLGAAPKTAQIGAAFETRTQEEANLVDEMMQRGADSGNIQQALDAMRASGLSPVVKAKQPVDGMPLTPRPDLPALAGGRAGDKVAYLKGPPNSGIPASNPKRIYLTDSNGNVVVDLTRERAKAVIPGQGFGLKRLPTAAELDLLQRMGR